MTRSSAAATAASSLAVAASLAPGEPAGDSTEQRLMRAAAHLFRTKGFQATSTRLLASATGVQSATLYYYMKNKEDLLYAICLRGNDLMIAEVGRAITGARAEGGPTDEFRAAVLAHLTTAIENRDVYLTTMSEFRSLSSRRRRDVVARRDEYNDLLLEVLQRAQDAGELRSDLDVEDLMLALRNMLSWTIFSFSADDGRTVGQLADLMVRVYLEGAAA